MAQLKSKCTVIHGTFSRGHVQSLILARPPSLYPFQWYIDIHGAVIISENGVDKALYIKHSNMKGSRIRECFHLYQYKHFSIPYLLTPPPGGGTDSLSLGTNCETTAPLFGQRTAPVLLPPNLQPPLFMGAQGQPLEINSEW